MKSDTFNNPQKKAAGDDFAGRFREIVSDPLNLLIERDPRAGMPDGDLVHLHNGLKVAYTGEVAYYGDFSAILVINRGVHEPLEEYVFQQLLRRLPDEPAMLELGAYWGHYSMWLHQARPGACTWLVEPDPDNLDVGRGNFVRNGFTGVFIHQAVGKGQFGVDRFLTEQQIPRLDILHADIQGAEVEMLEETDDALREKRIDYLFVSTHSQSLHADVIAILRRHGYRIEVAADFDRESTSYDGLVFASSPRVDPVFSGFTPMGRIAITSSTPTEIIHYLSQTMASG